MLGRVSALLTLFRDVKLMTKCPPLASYLKLRLGAWRAHSADTANTPTSLHSLYIHVLEYFTEKENINART